MDEKLNQVIATLAEIKKSLLESKPKWYDTLFRVVEVLMVPLIVAALAYYGNLLSTRVSAAQVQLADAQVKLAESNAADRREEVRLATQLKIFELAYTSLNSSEPLVQASANGLYKAMDRDFAVKFDKVVETIEAVSPELKDKIKAESERRAAALAKAANDFLAEFKKCIDDEKYSRGGLFNSSRLELISASPDIADVIQAMYRDCNGKGQEAKRQATLAETEFRTKLRIQ